MKILRLSNPYIREIVEILLKVRKHFTFEKQYTHEYTIVTPLSVSKTFFTNYF